MAAHKPDMLGTHALLSTRKGITSLSKFIHLSGAFTKTGEPPPHNQEPLDLVEEEAP